ncbi:MAG TPA: DUF1905 domain-containing protein [Actinomycetota bacterium]|jgi:hypothetical protein
MDEVGFDGTLRAARGGGHVVAVDEALAASIGAKHMTRVRGRFGGTGYRSNLAKMHGTLYLGVHEATVQAAGVAIGDTVAITMALDPDPRPSDRAG